MRLNQTPYCSSGKELGVKEQIGTTIIECKVSMKKGMGLGAGQYEADVSALLVYYPPPGSNANAAKLNENSAMELVWRAHSTLQGHSNLYRDDRAAKARGPDDRAVLQTCR
jgi:hypothetical protein